MGGGTRGPRDFGAQVIEYAAVILLASLVFAGLVIALPLPALSDGVREAVCKLLDLEDCDSGDTADDSDYEPLRCLRESRTTVGGGQIEVVVVIGEKFSFIEEKFAGGRTQLTLVDSTRLEAGIGAGVGVNVGSLFRAGAEINLGAGISVPNGSTWVFDSPEEAQELRDDLETKQKIDAGIKIGSYLPGGGLLGWGVDKIFSPDIRPPDITRTSVEENFGVDGSVGIGVGQDKSKTGDKVEPGPNDDDGSVDIRPRLGVEGAIQVNSVMSEARLPGGAVMTSYDLGGSANISNQWVVTREREAEFTRTGGMNVIRDKDGRITRLIIRQTAADADGPTVTMTDLEIKTPEDAERVEQWLGMFWEDQVLPLTWDAAAPTELGDDPTWFDRFVFENGRTSKVTYDRDLDIQDVSANVKLGVGLGLGGTFGSDELKSNKAEYLGAPRDGERKYVPYEECVATR